jgi:hypothetical protein
MTAAAHDAWWPNECRSSGLPRKTGARASTAYRPLRVGLRLLRPGLELTVVRLSYSANPAGELGPFSIVCR